MALLAAADSELALSRDAGTSWTTLAGVTESSISALAFSSSFEQDRTMLVGTAAGQVLASRDGGATWEQRALFEGDMVVALAASAEDLYLVTGTQTERGTWQLTLRGSATWQSLYSCEASQPAAVLSLSTDSNLYCAIEQHVVRVSDGELVAEVELADFDQASSLAAVEDVVLVGSRRGLYRSVDGAQSWERLTCDIPIVALCGVSPEKAYAVSMGGGVWQIGVD
jgi:photosystem II stability/assembly factor-like uncharacterized protein